MSVKELIAISGMSGVYKLVGNRKNGIIVEDLDTKLSKFVPARGHNFSPLETISIYTDADSTPIKDVFQNIFDQLETNPPIAPNSSDADLKTYFAKILPEYDRERVKISDIKKVIKWFGFIHERGYTTKVDEKEDSTTTSTNAE